MIKPPADILAPEHRLDPIRYSADGVSSEQLEKFLIEITLIRACPLAADIEPNAHTKGIPSHDRV